MKKIIISILLINLFTIPIQAETYSGSYSIALDMAIEPTYSIKIPKTIDVSNNETSFQYLICGDIYADQILRIDFGRETKIYSENRYCSVYITPDKNEFSSNELENEYLPYNVVLRHSDLEAGNYMGKISLVISLIGGA